MNKSILAVAVASVVAAAPIAASAAGTTLYGSFRTQIVSSDSGGDLAMGDGASRWGIKGSHDLGNGMGAIYKMERAFKSNIATEPEGGRLGYVGLTGGFGAVVLGQQWTPYYSAIAGSSDIFASTGMVHSSKTNRSGNALAYALPSGLPVSGAIAAVIAGGTDGDDVDAINAGFNVQAGPVKLGLGYHSTAADGDEDLVGVSAGGKFGGVGLQLLVEDDGGDDNNITATATYGGFAAQFGTNGDDNAITGQYTHKLGKMARVQLAVQDDDRKDDMKVVARLRVDF